LWQSRRQKQLAAASFALPPQPLLLPPLLP
jgi:hypothetical protein